MATNPARKTRGPGAVEGALREALKGKHLGEILLRLGAITEAQLQHGVEEARQRHARFGRCLLDNHFVTPAAICHALSLQAGLPTVDLDKTNIPVALTQLFSYLTMRRFEIIPFQHEPGVLRIAAVRPLRTPEMVELQRKTDGRVVVYLAPEDQIAARFVKIAAQQHKERRYPRYKAAVAATCRFCTAEGVPLNDKAIQGQVLDMSEGGFCLAGADPEMGPLENLVRDGVVARVNFTAAHQQVHGLCSLRFAKVKAPQSGAAACLFGLRILEMSEPDRSLLREMCIRSGILDRVRPRGTPAL